MIKSFISFTLLLCSLSLSAQTTKEWRDSISVLSQMIDKYPKDLELRMRKAEANIALEQWKYALDEYTSVIELHPGHIGALYFRGYVNRRLHRYGFARQDYQDVLHFAPDHKGALTGLILTNIENNHLQDAFDDANRLVDQNPDDPEAYSTRAKVEVAKGMDDFAIEDIDKAIDIEKEAVIASKTPLTINDNLPSYMSQKVSLLKKKGDKKGIENAVKALIKLGMTKTAARQILM